MVGRWVACQGRKVDCVGVWWVVYDLGLFGLVWFWFLEFFGFEVK